LRAAIASLETLSLSIAVARDDLEAFHGQAQTFVTANFPESNVVLNNSIGQQLLNTSVALGIEPSATRRTDVIQQILLRGSRRSQG